MRPLKQYRKERKGKNTILFCPYCNKYLAVHYSYCIYCGKYIEDKKLIVMNRKLYFRLRRK